MLKKILACGFAFAATAAFAQSTALVANNATDPANGPDAAVFSRTTHFTFDIQGTTGTADWTGSEVSVDVVGTGGIWHASDQRIAESPLPTDPNTLCLVHNLNSPSLTNTATNRNNTRMWDTFFTAPGAAFTVDPQFASPGGPNPNPGQCPPPPIVSTATRLRGINPQGNEIPLAWFDTTVAALNNSVLARLTFQVPANAAITGLEPLPGTVRFATITGKTTSSANPQGNAFSFTIYQLPEPSTLSLLALGGLAGLIRRR